jgi:uncharacterized repeat protein (TIGR02543 family)
MLAHLLAPFWRCRTALRAGFCFVALLPALALANCALVASVPERTPDSQFTANADGTVTHSASGLTWKRCSEGYDWDGTTCSDNTGASNTYPWADALAQAKNAAYAGYSDWRLPNIKELESLLETACSGTGPFINTTFFPATQNASYWSATSSSPELISALSVYFNNGYVDIGNKSGNGHVRLVRSGQSLGSFDALSNGNALTVTSINSGSSPSVNTAFNVVVTSSANVAASTTVTLLKNSGSGSLGGTTTCTISSGTNTCTVSGATWSVSESAAKLVANATGFASGLSAAFAVNKLSPTLALTSGTNPSTYGGSVTLTATLSGASSPSGTVNFRDNGSSLAACSAQTVSGSTATCTTSALTAGTHAPLTAVYSGDAANNGATSSDLSQTVSQATPAVSWATPLAITYGTALSATQLNASSAVAGVMTYSPLSGTVLPAGSQTLNATLTPTDGLDYTAGIASVTLVVNPASVSVTLGNLGPHTYDGSAKAATCNTAPTVSASLTYNGSATAPSAGGSYVVLCTVTAANYSGSASGILQIISPPPTYPIATAANPVAGGTLSCTPNPVTEGGTSTCAATPATGYTFSAWSGDCTGATCALSNITSAKTVTATFTPNTYAITAAASPTAGGSASCTPNPAHYSGSSTCTATPSAGYTFSAWSGDCTGSTCVLSNVTAAKAVTATFTHNTYAITAAASPTAGGSASCTPNPAHYSGSSTCTATPSAGYTFSAWSGDCSGSSCVLSNVVSTKNVTASFTLNTYAITAAASPAAGGSVSCTPNPAHYNGSSTCAATPSAGYTFSAWSGDCTGATCALTNVTAAKSVTAGFTASSTTTLTADPISPALAGQATTLTVRVSGEAGTPTGSVVFRDASSALGTVALNGSGGASYSGNFAIGTHSLSASYAGNTTYQPSVGNLSYRVASTIDTTLAVTTTPNPSQPGQSVPVSVSVTPLGNVVETMSGTVDVSGGGQTCRITLPAASCPLVFASKGAKRLTATYSGNSFYTASTGSATHYVGQRTSLTPILMLLLD